MKFEPDEASVEETYQSLCEYVGGGDYTAFGCINQEKDIKEKQYDLKIIIPAFNVEEYLKKCLDSVAGQQSRYNVKIVVIDDGSTDNTGQIADAYSKYKNFEIIHQENRGFSGARNTGINVIDSDYLMFVDSDDILPDGAVDKLMNLAVSNHAAIVEGSHYIINENGMKIGKKSHSEGILNPMQSGWGFPWGKVISSKYFEQIDFPKGYWYEDTVIMQIIYSLLNKNNEKFIGCEDVVYQYRKRKSSITRNHNSPKCIDTMLLTLSLARDREKLGLEYDQEYYEHVLDTVIISYRRTMQLDDRIQEKVFVVFASFINGKMEGLLTNRESRLLLEKAIRCFDYRIYKVACKFG